MPLRAITRIRLLKISLLLSAGCLPCQRAMAQGVDVIARVAIAAQATSMHMAPPAASDVVVWLTPLQPNANPATTGHPGPFRLVQKNKMFSPHLLVVPAGSTVEFPNQDPFFHNVFSLFNGKRFDLGLYESGTSRGVKFDREGVSYIFCNIHPEMGAVVVALSTPYWSVSSASGDLVIHDVPPGEYRMHVWSEAARPTTPQDAQRTVQVGSSAVHLSPIELTHIPDPMQHHKNKFGDEYRKSDEHTY